MCPVSGLPIAALVPVQSYRMAPPCSPAMGLPLALPLYRCLPLPEQRGHGGAAHCALYCICVSPYGRTLEQTAVIHWVVDGIPQWGGCGTESRVAAGLQSEVMAALKETGTPHKRGTKSQATVKGSSMNNILIKRFEEMDWDNNGEGR